MRLELLLSNRNYVCLNVVYANILILQESEKCQWLSIYNVIVVIGMLVGCLCVCVKDTWSRANVVTGCLFDRDAYESLTSYFCHSLFFASRQCQ